MMLWLLLLASVTGVTAGARGTDDYDFPDRNFFQVRMGPDDDDEWKYLCCDSYKSEVSVGSKKCEWKVRGDRTMHDLTNGYDLWCPEASKSGIPGADIFGDAYVEKCDDKQCYIGACWCKNSGGGERMHGAPESGVFSSISLVDGGPIFADDRRVACVGVHDNYLKTHISIDDDGDKVGGNKWKSSSKDWPDNGECSHFRYVPADGSAATGDDDDSLIFKGNQAWADGSLDECEGDCDDDGMCDGSLKCFHRPAYESVPGCPGQGSHNTDYCVKGSSLIFKENKDWEAGSLDKCEGDCDDDDDCKGSFKCFQRDGTGSVPGCSGSGKSGTDYCSISAGNLVENGTAHLAPNAVALTLLSLILSCRLTMLGSQ